MKSKSKGAWTPERLARFRSAMAAKRTTRVAMPASPRIVFEPEQQPQQLTEETLDLAWGIAKAGLLRNERR